MVDDSASNGSELVIVILQGVVLELLLKNLGSVAEVDDNVLGTEVNEEEHKLDSLALLVRHSLHQNKVVGLYA